MIVWQLYIKYLTRLYNNQIIRNFNNQNYRMTQLKWYILLFSSLLSISIEAQDIHWSQFNDNQIFQNPANAGNFKGDYRLIANYRSQWKSVSVPFNTISFSGDTRIEKYKKIGLGILFFNDAAGDGKFKTIEFQVNGAYSFKLTKDSTHIFRPGITIGLNHRQLNWDQFSFDNQYNGFKYDPTLPTNESFQTQKNTNFSIGSGCIYNYNKSERKQVTIGLSFFNLNKPNQGFFGDKVERDIRTSLFLKGNYYLTSKLDLLPSISYQKQAMYNEIIFGSNIKYTIIKNQLAYQAVYLGTWLRRKDAGYLSFGIDYQNWFLGMSYDFNFSQLVAASNVRGGIEFAARYIINRFKPKKIDHRVCPDYI